MKATTLATQPAQRTKGQWTGHYAARVIDWLIGSWFKVGILMCAVYGAYSLHVFVTDFETVGARVLTFTEYLYLRMEKEGTLS